MKTIGRESGKVLTVSLGLLAVLVLLHHEGEVVSLGRFAWEAGFDGEGVGEEDPVHGKAGSLDRVFVHFIY